MADLDVRAAREARIAGACYLLVIAGGIFAALFVREAVFEPGDAAATARAIAAQETLWRFGIAVHLVYLLAGTTMNVIVYRLFKHVHATMALIAFVLAMSDIAMEALLLTSLYVPLILIRESSVLGALSDATLAAVGYLAVRIFIVGWSFALLLFSGFCVLTGVLILRSRLVPRVIGGLMILAGASYFVNSLAGILSPGLAAILVPWILLFAFVGECSFGLWLATKGVKPPAFAPAGAMAAQPAGGDE